MQQSINFHFIKKQRIIFRTFCVFPQKWKNCHRTEPTSAILNKGIGGTRKEMGTTITCNLCGKEMRKMNAKAGAPDVF